MTLLSTAINTDRRREASVVQLVWYEKSPKSVHYAVFIRLKKYIFIDTKFNTSNLLKLYISKKH